MKCVACHEEFPDERAALGFTICATCGEAAAQEEIRAKATRVAPYTNKGATMYMGSDPATVRKAAREVGRKTTADEPSGITPVVKAKHLKRVELKRKVIGFYYRGGERYVLYADTPLYGLNADRIVYFTKGKPHHG